MGDLRRAGNWLWIGKAAETARLRRPGPKWGRNVVQNLTKCQETAEKTKTNFCRFIVAHNDRHCIGISGDFSPCGFSCRPCSCWRARPAHADYRITRDFGGLVEQYKAKYAQIRDRGERVIIDGICNSACTLVLGIVPLNKICVTPKASLGFHAAYYDTAYTFGIKVTSYAGTDDLMSYYPLDGEGLDHAARAASRRR